MEGGPTSAWGVGEVEGGTLEGTKGWEERGTTMGAWEEAEEIWEEGGVRWEVVWVEGGVRWEEAWVEEGGR